MPDFGPRKIDILGSGYMPTIICDCEGHYSRPLTYILDNNKDPEPLTLSMFLQDLKDISVPV